MVKSKVRFDGLDVAAMVAHWNRVALGRRIINIYNGPNGDTYLLKLDKQSGEASNMVVLLESGIRFHATNESYENPGMPTPFCSKLRKHLRGLRLESVQQLGNKDRVVLLTFGSGEAQRHTLILELYAKGNLLLTNSSYMILALLRSHDYDGAVQVQVGHPYPITYATTATTTQVAPTTTTSTLENADNDLATDETGAASTTTTTVASETLLSVKNPLAWYQNCQQRSVTSVADNDQDGAAAKGTKKKKKKKGSGSDANAEWRSLLLQAQSGVSHYGPSLMEHCLLCAGIDSHQQAPSMLLADDEDSISIWKKLQESLQTEGDRILANLELPDAKGYIFYQPKPSALTQNAKNDAHADSDNKKTMTAKTPVSPFEDKLLLEFQPHILKQHASMQECCLEYKSFNDATDAFFGQLETQKRMVRADTQHAQAEQRLEKIRKDQEQRLDQLLVQQESLKEQAELVEAHADLVDKAIQVVNSALDSGMDWEQLQDLVQVEQVQNQNPVALLIHKLDLESDSMILRLDTLSFDEGDEDEEESGERSKKMNVAVSLKDTAFGNASALFAKYRANKEKGVKTIEASAKALQAAEENAQRQLQEAQKRKSHLTGNLQTKRKPLWFEKFHWFITSDNYLVIAGRDAQQNEQIVKRYLRPGDAYLHADVHGAASCVLRAKRQRTSNGRTQTIPLSDQALREAGNFTICRSSAWASRMVTSAWWVESHQVSKTAPTGEYLTVGSFMIRGKKTFLPPSQLEMGLAVLFRLGDDEAIARHKNERRDFALIQLEDEEGDVGDDLPELAKEPPIAIKATISNASEPPSDAAVENSPLSASEPAKSEMTEESPKDVNDTGGISPDDTGKIDESMVNGEAPITKAAGAGDVMVSKIQGEANGEDAGSVATSSVSKSKKGLSVKDRKLIKKYGSLEAAQGAEDERKKAEDAKGESCTKPKKEVQQIGEAPKRGKKAKMKKMAKKYADQDDEDRELALLALHAGEKEKRQDKKKDPVISETAKEAAAQTMAILKKDASIVAQTLSQNVKEILAKCVTVQAPGSDEKPTVRWDKFDADVLEQLQSLEFEKQKLAAAKRILALKESTRIDNFSASLAGIIRTIRKYGHEGLETDANGATQENRRKTKAEKENDEEKWKQTLAEEGVVDDELEDDAVDDTTELSKLTGQPHVDDLILFAVPVCAPYHTLSKYAYRVKLTPGNMKRGKASKACIDMFLKDGQKTPVADRNKALVKKVADNEWVQAITGDVKISAPGASKAIQKQKSKKKSKKK